MPSFQATAAVLGVLLIVGALALRAGAALVPVARGAVRARRLRASATAGLEWIDFHARSGFVEDLAFVALIVILFRDGLEVEGEMLQRAWHLPLRKLVLAMPITAVDRRRSPRTC